MRIVLVTHHKINDLHQNLRDRCAITDVVAWIRSTQAEPSGHLSSAFNNMLPSVLCCSTPGTGAISKRRRIDMPCSQEKAHCFCMVAHPDHVKSGVSIMKRGLFRWRIVGAPVDWLTPEVILE